jgi:hypothetical protein
MIKNRINTLAVVLMFCLLMPGFISGQNRKIEKSLVAFWNFTEPAGQPRKSKNFKNRDSYNLIEANSPIKKLDEGPVANSSIKIEDKNWLYIPRDSLGELNIYGKKAKVTVIAWIKKESEKSWQAIAGVWDETHEKRQYYLFSNAHAKTHQDEMVRYPAKNLIHGHISASGGKSPGEQAWISYASSNDPVEVGVWTMIAMTYNGKKIKLYINGILSKNEKTNPFIYEDGIFNGGSDGADFTVGANHVQGKMTNQFIGAISGLSIFNKALREKDIKLIYEKGIGLN